MEEKNKKKSKRRTWAIIIGIFLVIAGGIDFLITTIPGVLLIYWGLTGKSTFNIVTVK